MKPFFKIISIAAFCCFISSCGAYKRLGYIQDMESDLDYSMPAQPDAIISKGDRLNIVVNCSTPELAAPFNVLNGVYNPSKSTEEGVKVGDASDYQLSGFEVDKQGNINYPILGVIRAEGLTLKELKGVIENQIMERKLIKEPIARVSFANFKITILGEAGKGIYNIPEGKIDIFGALALSRDLTDDAVRNDIWVVRTREGVRRLYRIDLTTKDCYYSPAFFLQQNDMIYAKPQNHKFDKTVENSLTLASSIISALATAVNIFFWTNNYARRY